MKNPRGFSGSVSADDLKAWRTFSKTVVPLKSSQSFTRYKVYENLKHFEGALSPRSTSAKLHGGAGRPEIVGNFEPRVRRDLARGKIAVEARLDLHGCFQSEAYERLLKFLKRQRARYACIVLVITGKGRRSLGGESGKLRRLVPMWLKEAPLRDLVLSCEPAANRDGGDGAFYVRLRKGAAESVDIG